MGVRGLKGLGLQRRRVFGALGFRACCRGLVGSELESHSLCEVGFVILVSPNGPITHEQVAQEPPRFWGLVQRSYPHRLFHDMDSDTDNTC